MHTSRNNTVRHKWIVPTALTIAVAVAASVIGANLLTPAIGAAVGALACVAAIVITYAVTKSAMTREVSATTDHYTKTISSITNEIIKTEKEINGNNWYARGKPESLEGTGQDAVAGMNRIIDSITNYFDKTPCVISVFDKDARFVFANELSRAQGFDPATDVGKTINDIVPCDESAETVRLIRQVATTGQGVNFQESLILPTGEECFEEYIMSPAKDAQGRVFAVILVNFDVSGLIRLKKQSEKVNAYQSFEAADITARLREGLSKGLLHFKYEPEPYDEDTANAQVAYRQIGETLQQAVDFIKGYVEEISRLLKEFSEENFDVAITQSYIGDFGSIKKSMMDLMGSMSRLVSEIQTSTAQVESGAEVIAQSSQELMSSFEEQNVAMSDVKEAVRIISEKTQRNADYLKSARELSGQVQNAAISGVEHMDELNDTMEEIKASSAEIAKVASIIEGIAFQTNLLALNASVEAARAGEHGRGFSVVADEVRSLAGRSADAARETSEMIAKSLNRVNEGVAKSTNTAEAFRTIVGMMGDTAEAMTNAADASREQADEINKIQLSMDTIYRGASDNATVVQSNASVSEELSSQVSMLMSLVSRFRVADRA